MIRLFTAVVLPGEVRQALGRMQNGVPGARWVEPSVMHLTLRFIGEVDENVAHDIDSVLAAIRAPAFELKLQGVGAFGGKSPRALWAGFAKSPPLEHLVAKIESVLQRIGLPAETRKFSPHVTLARLKESPRAKVADFVARNNLFSAGPFPVSGYTLFSSHFGGEGPRYVPERVYALTR